MLVVLGGVSANFAVDQGLWAWTQPLGVIIFRKRPPSQISSRCMFFGLTLIRLGTGAHSEFKRKEGQLPAGEAARSARSIFDGMAEFQ